MDREEVPTVLNALIQTCKDGEAGFSRASADVTDQDLQNTFLEFAAARKDFAEELQRLAVHFGEPHPETEGTTAGAAHRTFIDLKSMMYDSATTAVLEECLRGETSAVNDYEKALQEKLPFYAQNVIETQYREVRNAHEWIQGLVQTRAPETSEE